MDTRYKLDKLYEIKTKLHPLTMILIVGFVETQKRVLNVHDVEYVEKIFPEYYKRNGQLYGRFR